MKKTQVIEVFTNISASIVSFVSIAMFVAMGIAAFLGLQWSASALSNAFEKTFDHTHFHDIEIQIPYGLEEVDIDAIRANEGVEEVESGYVDTVPWVRGNATLNVKVQSITEHLDTLVVKEGTLPTEQNEIALMATWAKANKVSVGDTISFKQDGVAGMQHLRNAKYSVTALVESPAYLARDSATYGMSATGGGSIACVAFVPRAAFDEETYLQGVPSLYIRCKGTQGLSTFSREYQDKVNKVANDINSSLGKDFSNRLTTVYKLSSTLVKSLDGAADVLEAQVKVNEKTIAAINAEEKRGDISHDAANRKKEDANKQFDNELNDEVGQLALVYNILGIDLGYDQVDHTNASDVAKLLRQHASNPDGTEISLIGKDLKIGDIKQGADATRKLFDEHGRQGIVLDRSHNGGVLMAQTLINILESLRYSMAALFVLVGLLVCYSAISRLVHEHAVYIGTKKALGLFKSEVTMSYLLYSCLSVVLGVAIGAIAAVLVVEGILNPRLANVFAMGTYPKYLSSLDTLAMGGVELLLILLATWFSCHGILKRRAIELLSGEEPPTAKERFFEKWSAWKRLPLLLQTVVNNCINDKRRVVATLVGAAGCTALVVTAFTLNNNVMGSFDKQYRDIYGFDAIAYLDTSKKDAQANVEKALGEKSLQSCPVNRRTVLLTAPNGEYTTANLIVPVDQSSFEKMYHLNLIDGSKADPSQNGVWIAAGFANKSHTKVGDQISISDSSGDTSKYTVLGFFEHYLTTLDVVMSQPAYVASHGSNPTANALLVNTGNMTTDDLSAQFSKVVGYSTLRNDKALSKRAFNQFSKISQAVVVVYIALSALMAIVVLLNLDIMFINEKKRELIVLMICGYSVHDAKSYVAYDSIVLTLLGILLGVILGCASGFLTILSVEPANVMFIHSPNLPACLIGAGACAVFALIVGLIALRKIPRFNLTDISRT